MRFALALGITLNVLLFYSFQFCRTSWLRCVAGITDSVPAWNFGGLLAGSHFFDFDGCALHEKHVL